MNNTLGFTCDPLPPPNIAANTPKWVFDAPTQRFGHTTNPVTRLRPLRKRVRVYCCNTFDHRRGGQLSF